MGRLLEPTEKQRKERQNYNQRIFDAVNKQFGGKKPPLKALPRPPVAQKKIPKKRPKGKTGE